MVKLFLIFLMSWSSLGFGRDYPKSDHYNGEKFFNPGLNDEKTLWDVIKWKWNSHAVPWPESVPNKEYLLPLLGEGKKAIVTFINHASFLIQLPGLNILTDPIYSDRMSPFSFLGPKRIRSPGIPFESLPPIDVVLVSHNHYDHLDMETLKQLDGKFHPLFLVPLGDEKLLMVEGIQNVKEMDWWEEIKVKSARFIFTPSQHWSARTLWDKYKSLWGSFMVDAPPAKIYFAGDTGHGPHFLNIKTRLGAPDIALLPIGAYLPRSFMKDHHMDPEEAVKAHQDLGATRSIGMHFGTFHQTDEGIDDPYKALQEAKHKAKINPLEFDVLEQGDSYAF